MIPLRVEMDLVEEQEPQVDRSKLPTRPPVVCVLGHVDHGKTTLLDSLQQSSIAAGEAGGITQSMGAFSVPMEYGERDSVTFLDTPGHAAFKSMRARGANSDVTDVIVLVVSATDGVQPQTEEAIRLAQEANIPMVVAVNKCDRDDADPDNVLEELSYHGVITEDLDGDVLSVRISALKNQGMDELKDAIILTSEMSDLRASKEGAARAVVLESSTKQGVGHMLSVVVREGTMNVGDAFVCGLQYGKIKAMYDHRMKKIDTALPSTPVTIVGVDGVHSLDQSIQVYDNIDEARRVISQRQSQELIAAHVEAEESSTMQDASPSNLFRLKRNVGKRREKKILVGRSTAEKDLLEELEENTVNVMLKAEVSGSLEALEDYVNIMADNNVNINLVRSSVGPFQASDFDFAKDANASIISFGVEPSRKNLQLAESMGVEVKSSEIIYHLFDQMREKIIDKMPTKKHVSLQSKAEVRKMFQFTGKKKHLIAGCEVKKGTFRKEHPVRVMRDEEEVFLGPISSLKSFSEDADFITEGSECGIQLEGFLGVEEGDILESVIVTEERAKLDDRFARGYHEQEHVRDRREREMKKQSVEMSGADRTHLARDSSGASLHKVSFSEKVIDVEELTRIPGFAGDQKPKSQQGGFLKKRRM